MSDLISRQALCEYALNQKDKSVTPNDIMRFPSAQPELHYDEWCVDCKEYDTERHCCQRFNRVIREAVEECKAAQPEIIHCRDCKYAEVADKEDNQDGYTCQFHRGSIWFSGSYCSWAERREDGYLN